MQETLSDLVFSQILNNEKTNTVIDRSDIDCIN